MRRKGGALGRKGDGVGLHGGMGRREGAAYGSGLGEGVLETRGGEGGVLETGSFIVVIKVGVHGMSRPGEVGGSKEDMTRWLFRPSLVSYPGGLCAPLGLSACSQSAASARRLSPALPPRVARGPPATPGVSETGARAREQQTSTSKHTCTARRVQGAHLRGFHSRLLPRLVRPPLPPPSPTRSPWTSRPCVLK